MTPEGEIPIGDEANLVARLRAKDDRAYALVVCTYGPRLLATARRFVGDEETARDAVQDAFLQAFRSIDSFKGESRVSTWLHRIVVNAALMRLRTRRRRNETSIESMLPTFLEDGHRSGTGLAWCETPEELVSQRESRAAIRACIDRLPDDYRTVLLLRDIEEIDTSDVAAILGISPGAVKVRLHRARMALRELFEREFVRCAT
ncbi:MAG: sigma-70 family RNA polymerase sigma factor [Phycisphaerales bacterium]